MNSWSVYSSLSSLSMILHFIRFSIISVSENKEFLFWLDFWDDFLSFFFDFLDFLLVDSLLLSSTNFWGALYIIYTMGSLNDWTAEWMKLWENMKDSLSSTLCMSMCLKIRDSISWSVRIVGNIRDRSVCPSSNKIASMFSWIPYI